MVYYIKKIKNVILIQLMFHILYTSTNVVIPYLNKVLFDRVLIEGNGLLIKLIVCYLLAIVCNSLFQYISQVYEWRTSVEFNRVVKGRLCDFLLSSSVTTFNSKTIAEYLSVFNNDVEVLSEEYLDPLLDIIKSCISLAIYAVSLIVFVDWRVAIVIIALSLCSPFVSKYLAPYITIKQRRFLEGLEVYSQRLADIFSMKSRINSETIKTFRKLHQQQLDETEKNRLHYGKIKTLSNIANGLVMFLIQLASFIVVGYLLRKNELSIGAAVATFSYVENFIYPIKNILIDLNLINASKETLSIIVNLGEKGHELSVQTDTNGSQIIITNVSYHQENVNLEHLNLEFTAPHKYAIVGKSGVGKSTLLKLIMHQLPLQSGEIQAAVDQIFYLTQHEHFMKVKLEDNITLFGFYKDNNHHSQELWSRLSPSTQQALQSMNPMSELSGGERNLLGLLRALASDKKILLLDEPTAHLDKATADMVMDFLLSLDDYLIIMVLHHNLDYWNSKFNEVITIK